MRKAQRLSEELNAFRTSRVGSAWPIMSLRKKNHRRSLSVDDILREFPHLTPAQVYDALSYYYDHREQIDREIQGLTDLERASRRYPPTL